MCSMCSRVDSSSLVLNGCSSRLAALTTTSFVGFKGLLAQNLSLRSSSHRENPEANIPFFISSGIKMSTAMVKVRVNYVND